MQRCKQTLLDWCWKTLLQLQEEKHPVLMEKSGYWYCKHLSLVLLTTEKIPLVITYPVRIVLVGIKRLQKLFFFFNRKYPSIPGLQQRGNYRNIILNHACHFNIKKASSSTSFIVYLPKHWVIFFSSFEGTSLYPKFLTHPFLQPKCSGGSTNPKLVP